MFRRIARLATLSVMMLPAACSRHHADDDVPPEPVRPLAAYASQTVVLTPVAHVRADSLGWVAALGGPEATARHVDTTLATVLRDRGLAANWILPEALQRSYERNRTYATDPYLLATNPLRARALEPGMRYGDPLASQLRTMIALHEHARMVLLPVEFRLESVAPDGSAGTGHARGVLRLVLVDPRFAETRWVGEVRSDPVSTATAAFTAVATRLADLFAAP